MVTVRTLILVMQKNDDEWHHVATVFNSAQTEFYIDGTLDSKKASAGNVDLDSSEKKVPLDVL